MFFDEDQINQFLIFDMDSLYFISGFKITCLTVFSFSLRLDIRFFNAILHIASTGCAILVIGVAKKSRYKWLSKVISEISWGIRMFYSLRAFRQPIAMVLLKVKIAVGSTLF